MKARSPSRSARTVVVYAARIARLIEAGDIPPDKAWFLLAAALVGAARRGDTDALELGLASLVTLREGLPENEAREFCRGQLGAAIHFAWLLKAPPPTQAAILYESQEK